MIHPKMMTGVCMRYKANILQCYPLRHSAIILIVVILHDDVYQVASYSKIPILLKCAVILCYLLRQPGMIWTHKSNGLFIIKAPGPSYPGLIRLR